MSFLFIKYVKISLKNNILFNILKCFQIFVVTCIVTVKGDAMMLTVWAIFSLLSQQRDPIDGFPGNIAKTLPLVLCLINDQYDETYDVIDKGVNIFFNEKRCII